MKDNHDPPSVDFFVAKKLEIRKEFNMAETENTQTSYDQVTNLKPVWLIEYEKLQKVVAQDPSLQIVFRADHDNPCVPQISTKKMTTDDYPLVVEAPTGFWTPQRDWGKGKWIETANIQQGKEIEDLKKQVSELSKTTETVQTQQKNQNVESAQSSQLMMMVTKQLGIMNTKIDNLADKIAPVAPSTQPTTPMAPTQPTTATQVTTPAPKEGGAQ